MLSYVTCLEYTCVCADLPYEFQDNPAAEPMRQLSKSCSGYILQSVWIAFIKSRPCFIFLYNLTAYFALIPCHQKPTKLTCPCE